MILFLLVFTFFQYQQTQGLNNNLTSNPLFEWYLPEQWVIAAFQNQFTPFLLLFVTHGGVMVTVLVFISPWLYRLNQTQNNQRFQLAKAIDYQPRSLWRHLLGMEWQRFIHSPIYILNTGFGVLMLLLASTALLFIPDIPMIIQAIQVEIPIPVESLWFAIVGFTMATVYTPAVSLSLEGKNINTIKSLPLSIMTLSMGKILFNLLITFPVLIISHLIFTLVFRVPFLEGVMTLILLGAFVIFLSTFYYWVNLLFPRFDFQQDVEVVKQSLAALIGVMGGIGWTAFLVISYTQWFSAWPSYQRYLFLTLVLMSATLAMLLAIKKWAPRLFRGFSV
jgi:ABC-2 type transport system permease protein